MSIVHHPRTGTLTNRPPGGRTPTRRTLSIAGTALTVAALFLPAFHANAAFPGANGDLVFARFTHGQNDLWVLDPLTSALTRLTDSPQRDEGLADWNADGTQIAFVRCSPSKLGNCDIWLMDADGSNGGPAHAHAQ